jgi:hypothetical protein
VHRECGPAAAGQAGRLKFGDQMEAAAPVRDETVPGQVIPQAFGPIGGGRQQPRQGVRRGPGTRPVPVAVPVAAAVVVGN